MTDLFPAAKTVLVLSRLLATVLLLAVFSACSSRDAGVDDPGGLLTHAQKQRITHLHTVLLKELDMDFFLAVSAKAVPEIDKDASELFERYKVGRKSTGSRGVLLLVDPHLKQIRAEISYSLEPVFPDSFVGYIQRRQMLPYFRHNNIGQGIEAAVELFVARAMQAAEGKQFNPTTEIGSTFLSGGGGADTQYGRLNSRLQSTQAGPQVTAQPSPQAALEAYIKVLADHNKRPDLLLYTPETRLFFSKWTVTDAQFDHVLQNLRSEQPEKIIINHELAVIRYPVQARRLSPFLLIHGKDGWMFDFATMHKVIGMNHKNQWHFLSRDHPYMFGFVDLRFDRNGFPF